MIWARLKEMRCPRQKCGMYLESAGLLDGGYRCQSAKCDYSIGEARFNDLVESLYRPKAKQSPYQNAAELEELGRPVMSEDFSDRI